MSTASSIIRVSIIGDAKKLVGAIDTANKKTDGLLSSGTKVVAGSLLALGVIDKAFDFVNTSLDNADKYADAIERISGATSADFAANVASISDDFTKIGLSNAEFADFAAKFVDLATAAGTAQPLIEKMTPDIVTLATAVAATTGKTVDEVIEDIGKAIKGSQKPVEEYGIVIDSALSPDDQLTSIIDQLTKKFPDAQKAAEDFAGAQGELDAKMETFSTHVGMAVEGPLTDLLNIFNTTFDNMDNGIEGYHRLHDVIKGFSPAAFPQLGDLFDLLNNIIGAAGQIKGPALGGSVSSDREVTFAQRREAERNGGSRVGRDATGQPNT
jgi:hypothetical protein